MVYSGSPESDDFHKWVGICIKEWAKIEACLYDICGIVLKPADPKHVAIIYGRTPNIDARLTLTSELVLTILPSGHQDVVEWTQLIKDIRALCKTRNLLAHAPAEEAHGTMWIQEEGGEEQRISRWHEVSTSKVDELRGKQVDSIDQHQLPGHHEDVYYVWIRLLTFASKLRESRRIKRPQRKPRR